LRQARPDYTVHVGNDPFTADASVTDWLGQAQVSVGVEAPAVAEFLALAGGQLTLAALKAQISALTGTPQESPMPPAHRRPDGVHDMQGLLNSWTPKLLSGTWASRKIRRKVDNLLPAHAGALSPDEQAKLRGLWTLMMTYWARLTGDPTLTSYRKIRLLALARTDFHSSYRDLVPAAQAAFEQTEALFISDTPGDTYGVIPGTRINLRRWYESVMHPEAGALHDGRRVDLLSAKVSGTGEAVATGTDKSMGEHPLDTTGWVPKAVFELRAITPGIRIPISLVYQHLLLPIFQLVQQAEQPRALPRNWQQ
jgi:hypothetical protein